MKRIIGTALIGLLFTACGQKGTDTAALNTKVEFAESISYNASSDKLVMQTFEGGEAKDRHELESCDCSLDGDVLTIGYNYDNGMFGQGLAVKVNLNGEFSSRFGMWMEAIKMERSAPASTQKLSLNKNAWALGDNLTGDLYYKGTLPGKEGDEGRVIEVSGKFQCQVQSGVQFHQVLR